MKSKTISTQTAAFHIGHSGTVLQKHYDVSVIIASVLRPTLKRTLHSIFRQDFSGQIHILIGIDKSKKSRQFLYDICKSQPKNCLITVLDLGYSTSVRHGGLRLAQDGGSLRTTLTYMTNSRYISYLDDDNWWGSQHLSTVLTAIEGHDWAFSLRWFVDPKTNEPLCIDRWESTGVDSGVYKNKFGGHVDGNCLLIDSLKCDPASRLWSLPLKGDKTGMSTDRSVFSYLQKNTRYRSTNMATCFYTINPMDGMHKQRLKWINKSS